MSTKSQTKYLKKKYNEHLEHLEKRQKNYLIKNMKEYQVNCQIELLEFLFKTIDNQSKNNIKNLLSKKYIAVNGLCVTQYNYMLYKGDMVMISKDPLPKTKTTIVKQKQNTKPILDIIYEDKNYLVINKPTGLLSIESDKEKQETAYKKVLEYLQKDNQNTRAFQVHRIDKETSGVLLFTKDFELKEQLKKNWNKLVKRREYLAIVEGEMPKKEDTIVVYLKETDTHIMYVSQTSNEGIKSITHYKVLSTNGKYSLLLINIETGRKNQIRVTLSSMGHPIIGDDKYESHSNPLQRLGLHASALIITDPISNNTLTFKAKTPKEFNKMFRIS